MSENDNDTGKWAVVELMGRTVKAGKVYPVEVFGAEVMRIVVPEVDGVPEHTLDYNWKNAGYSITYTTEEVVRAYLSQMSAKPPVILYERSKPALMQTVRSGSWDDADDDLDDDDLDDDLEF